MSDNEQQYDSANEDDASDNTSDNSYDDNDSEDSLGYPGRENKFTADQDLVDYNDKLGIQYVEYKYEDPEKCFKFFNDQGFPDGLSEELIEGFAELLEHLDYDNNNEPTREDVEVLLKILGYLRQLFTKAQTRSQLWIDADKADPEVSEKFYTSLDELGEISDSMYETVLKWCNWLYDMYVDTLQGCLPTKLPSDAWDRIIHYILSDYQPIRTESTSTWSPYSWSIYSSPKLTSCISTFTTGDISEQTEKRLIAGCSAAAAQLFKLMYAAMFRVEPFDCAIRLRHHIRIFDSAMRSYDAFIGKCCYEETSSPPAPLPGAIRQETIVNLPTCRVKSFNLGDQSLKCQVPYFAMRSYCKSDRAYHVYVLFPPDNRPQSSIFRFDVPLFYTKGSPPSVFPSDDYIACLTHWKGKSRLKEKSSLKSSMLLYDINQQVLPKTRSTWYSSEEDYDLLSDRVGKATSEVSMEMITNTLNVINTVKITIDEVLGFHLTVDSTRPTKLRGLLHFKDQTGVSITAILLITLPLGKRTGILQSAQLSLVTIVSGGSLLSAMQNRYFLLEASQIVLYKGCHQEVARTDVDPSNPWNVRFDVSGADRFLFYRGCEVQVRGSDLSVERSISLQAAPSNKFHLSLHGDLIFGQNEATLKAEPSWREALPYFEPFILTFDNVDPLYLPEWPSYGNLLAIYAGHLTAEGKLKIMSVSLNKSRTKVLILNRVFETFPEGKLDVMLGGKRATTSRGEVQRKRSLATEADTVKEPQAEPAEKRRKIESKRKLVLAKAGHFFSGTIHRWHHDFGFTSVKLQDVDGVVWDTDVFVHISCGIGRQMKVGERIQFCLLWDVPEQPNPMAVRIQEA